MSELYLIKQKRRINVVFEQKEASLPQTDFKFEERVSHAPLERLEMQLNHLVGMDEVKRLIRELYAWLYVCKKRDEAHLKVEKHALHMLFKGNPGTGKTTIARLLGKLFVEMGILDHGQMIEAERADLVGEYIGQTAQKTRELIRKAAGGVLFIDEAYSLARGGEKDFGKEAIDTLVKHMDDQQERFVLILAGYPEEMEDFLDMNPGLPSRFPMILNFDDFSADQLLEIGKQMMKERQYIMTREAEKRLAQHLIQVVQSEPDHFSNGRYVRNVVERMIRRQAVRLVRESIFDRDALQMIRACDMLEEVGSQSTEEMR
ncbi:MAG: AAA family ATPase [Sporolactobacillus sp.]